MTMGKAKSESETNKLSLGTATFFFGCTPNTHSPLCDPIISYLGAVLFLECRKTVGLTGTWDGAVDASHFKENDDSKQLMLLHWIGLASFLAEPLFHRPLKNLDPSLGVVFLIQLFKVITLASGVDKEALFALQLRDQA